MLLEILGIPWKEHQTNVSVLYELNTSRMWANAQRDGRPAEHRWRTLFNAAKFG